MNTTTDTPNPFKWAHENLDIKHDSFITAYKRLARKHHNTEYRNSDAFKQDILNLMKKYQQLEIAEEIGKTLIWIDTVEKRNKEVK
jgi:hypothetical protein